MKRGGWSLWTSVALGLIVLVAHLPLRHSQYIQDDLLAVERNPIVERGDPGEILSTSYWEGVNGGDRALYRPLVIASYALERRLTGRPDPFVSQTVNVVLHLLVTLTLLRLALRLGAGPLAATAAAGLFAVHPAHVEAIANIVGRAELLAALCSLWALQLLTRSGPWLDGPATRPRLAAWAAAAALGLALGSKEIAIVTPALMVALELLLRPAPAGRTRGWWIDRAGALAPSALAAVVFVLLRARALGTLMALQPIHRFDNPLVEMHGAERIATALGLVTRYARLLLFPTRLAADYSGGVIPAEPGLLAPRALAGMLLLALLALPLALVLLDRGAVARPRLRLTAFASTLCLLPYLVIGNLLFPVGAIFAERLIYFPSLGAGLLAGIGFDSLGRLGGPPARDEPRVRRVLLLLGIFIAAFMLQTWHRCLEWRDNESVFASAARVNPASPRAHFVLGKLSLDRGRPEAAIEHFDRTLALQPDHPTAWLEKGNAYAALGRYREAEAMYRECLRLSPSYATAHRNLALALRHLGRLPEAEIALRRSLIWDPRSATGWAELGNLYLQTRRWAEAADAYRRAIALGRSDLAPRLRMAETGAGDLPAGR